jgi:succinoglycan biosynthesis transport protein ExoP
VLGLVWAFVIELFLDHSVRRPTDVERILQLPLFLSIPRFKRKQLAAPAAPVAALPAPESGPPDPDAKPAPTPSSGELALAPYYQTLRDRLIDYFGSINLVHKPKLVAVTGLGRDTGVTTLAAGLARSFSEIGEGNVLLVDMTQGQGSAQQFHKGTPVDIDQLLDTKGSAFVRSHLYVVTESSSSERLAKGMPQRFNQLIPKLKASDFDYIIFDMPPVNQISITPRLANFMDMMLLVLESEKADRDLAQKASDLLAKSKTPVGVVLNKNKSYVPARIHQEREFVLGM